MKMMMMKYADASRKIATVSFKCHFIVNLLDNNNLNKIFYIHVL